MNGEPKVTREQWAELVKLSREAHASARSVMDTARAQMSKTQGMAVDVLRELIERQWQTIEAIEQGDLPTAKAGAFEDLEYMTHVMHVFLRVPAAGDRAPGYFDGERVEEAT